MAAGQQGLGTEGAVQWLVKDVAAELRAWGHQGGVGGTVIMKCDGGRSIVRIAIDKFHGGQVIPEGPVERESQPNGRVEEAGKTVRGPTIVFNEQTGETAKIKL